jgi:hypothetical protein
MAQAPNPTTDASIPDFPNGRYFIFFLFLSQVPVAAHNSVYAHLILTSPADGTHDVPGNGAERGKAPGYSQKDANVRNQQKQ